MNSQLESMHNALLEALRHREQEIFSYLAILVPAVGGFAWLLLYKTNAVAMPSCVTQKGTVFFLGTVGVVAMLFAGTVYSLSLGYNYRYITFQLAKIEHYMGFTPAILKGWPRSPKDFQERYRRPQWRNRTRGNKKWYRHITVPWCTPPEIIRVFWLAFSFGIVWVVYTATYISTGRFALAGSLAVCSLPLTGFVGPIYFGCKLHRLCKEEGDSWPDPPVLPESPKT